MPLPMRVINVMCTYPWPPAVSVTGSKRGATHISMTFFCVYEDGYPVGKHTFQWGSDSGHGAGPTIDILRLL